MNYEAAYLVKLEGIVTAMGGVVSPMTTPTSFEARSLQLLDAISAASGGGFTYNQTAEPVGPTAGQTWRERSAGGLILGEWEWSGSLWLGVKTANVIFNRGADFPTFNDISAINAVTSQIPFRKCMAVHAIVGLSVSSLDSDNRWDIDISFNQQRFTTPSVAIGTLVVNTASYRIQRKDLLNGVSLENDAEIRIVARKIGTPGNLTSGITVVVREVRT